MEIVVYKRYDLIPIFLSLLYQLIVLNNHTASKYVYYYTMRLYFIINYQIEYKNQDDGNGHRGYELHVVCTQIYILFISFLIYVFLF